MQQNGASTLETPFQSPDTPDASAPHTPVDLFRISITCFACPTGECKDCPASFSSFYKTLCWDNESNNDPFIVPTDLILAQRGWICCQCEPCNEALKKAMANHRIPHDVLQQVFGPTVSIFHNNIEHSWRILAALRLSTNKGITAFVCGKGMTPQGQKVPMWKKVPLETLIKWNPDVLKSETAIKLISPWRISSDLDLE